MAEPSNKSEAIEQTIQDMFGIDRKESITTDTCVFCKLPATQFTDELSRKEFTISGMCQSCQDSTFGTEEE